MCVLCMKSNSFHSNMPTILPSEYREICLLSKRNEKNFIGRSQTMCTVFWCTCICAVCGSLMYVLSWLFTSCARIFSLHIISSIVYENKRGKLYVLTLWHGLDSAFLASLYSHLPKQRKFLITSFLCVFISLLLSFVFPSFKYWAGCCFSSYRLLYSSKSPLYSLSWNCVKWKNSIDSVCGWMIYPLHITYTENHFHIFLLKIISARLLNIFILRLCHHFSSSSGG